MNAKPVALVTGGTRGIGLAIALELARSGFDIAVNGRRPESDVSDALNAIQEAGAHAAYIRGDVGDDGSRSAMLDEIRDRFGRRAIARGARRDLDRHDSPEPFGRA